MSVIKKQLNNTKDQHIIGIALLFGLFAPNGSFFYLAMPIVTLLLAWRYFSLYRTTNTRYLIAIVILTSFVVFSLTYTGNDYSKGLSRSVSIFLLILFFPFVKGNKIPNIYLYAALIYIFISQVSYIIGFNPIIKFFNDFYPYEGDRITYQAEHLETLADQMTLTNRYIRLGGLYKNPNQCARYLTILFAVFLIENNNRSIKLILPFLFAFSLGIVATGSRTGFFIAVLIFAYFIYRRSQNVKSIRRYIIYGVSISIIVVFFFAIKSGLAADLRFLDYDEGLNNSFFARVRVLNNYVINNDSVVLFLFGNFINDGSDFIIFDTEWGGLIYRYGVLSIFSFLIFYISVFKTLSKKNRIIFITLFWLISSSMILSFRASFIFMLLLSKYFSEDLEKRKTLNISNN